MYSGNFEITAIKNEPIPGIKYFISLPQLDVEEIRLVVRIAKLSSTVWDVLLATNKA